MLEGSSLEQTKLAAAAANAKSPHMTRQFQAFAASSLSAGWFCGLFATRIRRKLWLLLPQFWIATTILPSIQLMHKQLCWTEQKRNCSMHEQLCWFIQKPNSAPAVFACLFSCAACIRPLFVFEIALCLVSMLFAFCPLHCAARQTFFR